MIEAMLGTEGYGVLRMTSKVGAGSIVLPVAHAFDTPDGFIVVAPGYIDPVLSGVNHLHRIVAAVSKDGTFDGPELSGQVELYEPTARQLVDTNYTLEWFDEQLGERGLTLDGERLRLRADLSEELARSA